MTKDTKHNYLSLMDKLTYLMLRERPESFNGLTKEQIKGMDEGTIYCVLRKRPELFDKFSEEQINKMSKHYASQLLEEQPGLSPLFNKEGNGIAEDFEETRSYLKCLYDPEYYRGLDREEKERIRERIRHTQTTNKKGQ